MKTSPAKNLTDSQILTLREILGAESRACLDRLRHAAHAELKIQLVRALSDGILAREEIHTLCRGFQGFAQIYAGTIPPEADGGRNTLPPAQFAEEITRFALARFEREPRILADDPACRRAYADRVRTLMDAGFARTLAVLAESPADVLAEIRRIRKAIVLAIDTFVREGLHAPAAPVPLAG